MRLIQRKFFHRFIQNLKDNRWLKNAEKDAFPQASIFYSHFRDSSSIKCSDVLSSSCNSFLNKNECIPELDPYFRHFSRIPCLFSTGFSSPSHFLINQFTRNYAAPVNKVSTGKKKFVEEEEAPKKDERRINRAITSQFIRVISDEGNHVYSRSDALRLAMDRSLDLVEVDGKSDPPVAKLMDYSRYRFEEKRKEKEMRKKQLEKRRMDDLKEIRFGARTEHKDLVMKVSMARKLLQKGHRIKCTVQFRKNDVRSNGKLLLDEVMKLLKEDAKIEVEAREEGTRMWMLVRPLPKKSTKSQIESSLDSSVANLIIKEDRIVSLKGDAEFSDDDIDDGDDGDDDDDDDGDIDDGDGEVGDDEMDGVNNGSEVEKEET